MNADKPGLFDELKRRHVWRVAIAYAIAGWLIVQIATQVFPFFRIPDWAVRLVVLLLVIGFPVAVGFAWVYELTPTGLRRTAPAGSPEVRAEPEHRSIGQKLNNLIIVVLVLAVAVTGWRLYTVKHQSASVRVAATTTRRPDNAKLSPGNVAPTSAAAAEVSGTAAGATGSGLHATQAIPKKSIAVLPFINDSGAKDQQFFSDGLSEDLITALSQFEGLKVISRESAFQFRNSKDTSAQIGRLLGVAHLLEGSVQRAGDEVRITATLVNAADGTVLWTQRYDKPYKALFALQDAITQAVATALKAKLLTTPGAVVQSDRPPSGNLKAWQAYQQGKFYGARATQADIGKALNYYSTATRLDPRYAAAYAHIAADWTALGGVYLGGTAKQNAYVKAQTAVEKALALAPNLAGAHLARGTLLANKFDWAGAQADYHRAAQLTPNDAKVQASLAILDATLGHVATAVTLARKAQAADPLDAGQYNGLSSYLGALGQLDAAQQAIDKAIELQPKGDTFHAQLAWVAILRGDAKAALAAARQESDPTWRQVMLAQALQIGPDKEAAGAALQTLIANHADGAPYQIAETYALRRDPDAMFTWLYRAWAARDPGVQYLLYDPLILRYRNDPRFAAFCRKIGLPITTDAVAIK
ncbi:MAG TPA: hypothetical protein VFW60_07435 [Rhodanobacteraceae bacterium]|nr:hypothetical protein [Rhodanobacteraceae bacterium]